MKRLLLVAALGTLAACADRPPVPDWLLTAETAIGNHAHYLLQGRDKLAAGQLAMARAEVARTGDATQMARIELRACASRLASLEDGACPAIAALASDAGQAETAYAAYLDGRIAAVDIDLLPEMQRLAWRHPDRLHEVADPLSRLVAAAALLRDKRLPPAGIALAIDTAAAQGWRRPLLAWLMLERERLQHSGDEAGVAAVNRRLDRISGQSR